MRVRTLLLVLLGMALAAWLISQYTVKAQPAVSAINYHVETVDSREVMIVCTNGAQPLLSQSVSLPTVVSVKCMDIAAK